MKSLRIACLSFSFVSAAVGLRAQSKDTSFSSYVQKIPQSTVSFRMIAVPGGSFTMGSPVGEKGRKEDEGPAMKVTVDPFWIEEHETTYDEYILYQDETRDSASLPDGVTRPSPPYLDFTLGMGKTGGFPANSMSQYAVIMYCRWLYNRTGIFYRLPTEAEWEYACRAGSSTAYPFGGDAGQLAKYAWFAENSGGKYHAVGQLKPNAWGLYDMLGNVDEWTLDQYKADYFDKIKSNGSNPQFAPVTKYPITLRGGSFRDEASEIRSAARIVSQRKWNERDPQIPRSKWWNTDAPFIGFRVVRPARQPSAAEAAQWFEKFLSIK